MSLLLGPGELLYPYDCLKKNDKYLILRKTDKGHDHYTIKQNFIFLEKGINLFLKKKISSITILYIPKTKRIFEYESKIVLKELSFNNILNKISNNSKILNIKKNIKLNVKNITKRVKKSYNNFSKYKYKDSNFYKLTFTNI